MKKFILYALLCLFASNMMAFASEDVLSKVNSPCDIKKLSVKQMKVLAQEIREGILHRVNLVGGHLGPDLGIVEATIAMHYVFDSPTDKFVFDVSHQTYPHKMLTGRKDAFLDPLNHTEISGYSNPKESPHDLFVLGHTSTSVSLATGLAKSRDLKGEKYNVIALIGDGSLSGGEALEGLNNASVLESNFIVIVNDNEMSIAENQGGLYKNLRELRESNGLATNNIFKAMGFDYYYVENGNDINELIKTFKKVKDTTKPTVVHIHTLKGKGYQPAEENKELYHWHVAGFMNSDEKPMVKPNYTSITVDYLTEKRKDNPALVVISPATPSMTGFTPDVRKVFGANFVDVGIAEEHAVAFASGIATNGGKPVLLVGSSFIQRAYDQLSQDLSLNNSPAVILVYRGGISNADMTHLGVFDIPLIINIPNIVYLAPTNKEEYIGMLDWATTQNSHSVAIRVPNIDVVSTGMKDETDYSVLNKFKVIDNGEKIAIIGVGNFFELAKEVKQEIKDKLGIDATLINPCFLTGLDGELLEKLKSEHSIIITLEDGCVDGGFGEKISRYYSNSDMKVLNYGAEKEFTDRVPLEELYKRYHLTKELILDDVVQFLPNEE
jgi:1-deoxy-D-xylulose-5-phosphate synthase